jgi:hypothetical protein
VKEGLLDLTKQLIAEDLYRSFSGNSFQSKEKKTDSMACFSKTQLLPTLHIYLCRHCPMSSETELSAVVFGRHVHLILVLVIFSSEVVRRTKFTTVTPERKKN